MKPKFKNTYSRKNQTKQTENSKKTVNINVININLNLISVNISNNGSTPGRASKSDLSDMFDKLMKGPTYNNRSTSSSAECSRKFFSQRQDTASLYKSDAEFSISTDISNHLFRDSKDSYCYSPTWKTPAQYCKVKNKLVKIEKMKIDKKIKKTKQGILNLKKTSSRVQKKGRIVRPNQIQSVATLAPCNSSTPNGPKTLPKTNTWKETNFSPILPVQYSPGISFEQTHDADQNMKAGNQNSSISLSALIAGFGNLGMETPIRRKLVDLDIGSNQELKYGGHKSPMLDPCIHKNNHESVNSSVHEPELFDYNSPLNTKSKNLIVDELEQSVTESSLKSSGVEEKVILNNLNSSTMFSDKSSCKSGEDISTVPVASIQDLEEFDLEDGVRSQEISCKSPYHYSMEGNNRNVSGCSGYIPNSTQDLGDLEESSVCRGKLSSRKLSSSSSDGGPSDKYSEEVDSRKNVTRSYKKICSDSDSESKLTSSTHNAENPDNINFNSSSSSIKDEDKTSEMMRENSDILISNDSTSPGKESKSKESQPLNDVTNVPLGLSRCGKTKVINKRSTSFWKENKRSIRFDVKDCASLQPRTSDLNETAVRVNLEAGKKWRRSLIRQKPLESKFDRRVSMSADVLVKLIKESSGMRSFMNDSKLPYNNTTRIGLNSSVLEDQDARNTIQPVLGASPEFNLSFSKLSKIQTRRRRMYCSYMNEIPEECSDQSSGRYNQSEICREDSVLKQNETRSVECESSSVNQTDVYETPPILKMNPEALSAITDRKRSRICLAKSLGDCSIFLVDDEKNVSSDEENNFYTSCCSKLDLEDDLEHFDEQDVELGKVGFLLRCGQYGPMDFTEAIPERVLETGRKIGEGVYGEVFMLERPGEGATVIKIIPVEGSQLVNGAVQKKYDEVLSELIITEELSLLRKSEFNSTSGFCELKNKFFLTGEYPSRLLELWQSFHDKNGSDNDCPSMFGPNQLYLALELAHAGEPVETFPFKSPQQALGIFLQTTFSLAVAESEAEFEHRDLHIGNVLVKQTSAKYVTFVLNGMKFECPTFGAVATIIDYTLSRIAFKGDVLYLDLENDPELFTAEGDYQFDIYRQMREDLNMNWRDHQPKTNVRWIHYIIDKLTVKIKYKQKKTTKMYKENMELLIQLKAMILDFYSASDLAQHLIDSYFQITSLIVK